MADVIIGVVAKVGDRVIESDNSWDAMRMRKRDLASKAAHEKKYGPIPAVAPTKTKDPDLLLTVDIKNSEYFGLDFAEFKEKGLIPFPYDDSRGLPKTPVE